MRTLFSASMILLAATAADPRAPLVGLWLGDSVCTAVRPACRDEKAAYHVALAPAAHDVVSMTMNKIVDGSEVEMGVLEYKVDFRNHRLSSEFTRGELHLLWSFTWSGSRMKGTLKSLPAGDVIRNITLTRKR